LEEERCIFNIILKLGTAYSMFVNNFYAMREDLGKSYQKTTIETFCDSLIRVKYNLVQLGVIKSASTSNKSLVAQQKDKTNNPKKQHPFHKNKQHKGPKPTQTTSARNGDKGEKSKNKNTERHYNFCDKYGHDASNYFNNMAA
jgi:hypothetical protein